ncbi:MAG: 2-hydroxyacyl-CoA dehydratase family protein [Firmicutes bacterium]|nr:2-hydroxyacyl-CoA dehydratase family protein [Bacillota bacterium]MCL5038776.1 2-hydroxyacyl-CoA dehydratase family protein [Bacillota bacterium]
MEHGETDGISTLLAAAQRPSAAWPKAYPEIKFFGFFCSYWPEELALSVGWEPLRLLPPLQPGMAARLPAYTCAVGRGCLAQAENGAYRQLAGVGFAHTCDTMQSLFGVWRSLFAGGEALPGDESTFMVVPPANLLAIGAESYYRAELELLWHRLMARAGQKPEEEALRGAIRLANRIRRQVEELERRRAWLPSDLVAALLRAGQLMPRANYDQQLAQALKQLEDYPSSLAGRVPLVLSGSVLEGDGIYRLIEDLGGRVVADDTCTGTRHYLGLVDEEEEPLLALARRHLSRPACPCRHQGLPARLDHLKGLLRQREARGVLLVLRKYCEPHAWDAVPLRDGLRDAGVPALILELDGTAPGEQERTRLQAFLEGLAGGS